MHTRVFILFSIELIFTKYEHKKKTNEFIWPVAVLQIIEINFTFINN